MNSPLSTNRQCGNFNHVVSLGCHCQPAHQIRRVLNIDRAHVFDWLISPHRSIRLTFESRFSRFFARSRLQRNENNRVIDTTTGLQFFHNFSESEFIDKKDEELSSKYRELISRMRDLLEDTAPALFVRQQSSVSAPIESALDLVRVLTAAAPQLPFTLLYITPEGVIEPLPRDTPHIIYRTIAYPPSSAWTGDDLAWERVHQKAIHYQPGCPLEGRNS